MKRRTDAGWVLLEAAIAVFVVGLVSLTLTNMLTVANTSEADNRMRLSANRLASALVDSAAGRDCVLDTTTACDPSTDIATQWPNPPWSYTLNDYWIVTDIKVDADGKPDTTKTGCEVTGSGTPPLPVREVVVRWDTSQSSTITSTAVGPPVQATKAWAAWDATSLPDHPDLSNGDITLHDGCVVLVTNPGLVNINSSECSSSARVYTGANPEIETSSQGCLTRDPSSPTPSTTSTTPQPSTTTSTPPPEPPTDPRRPDPTNPKDPDDPDCPPRSSLPPRSTVRTVCKR